MLSLFIVFSLLCSFRFAGELFFFEGLPLVVIVFASGKPKLELHEGMLEIDLGGNDGIPFALHHAAKFVDLTPIEKEHAVPPAGKVEVAALFIGGDMEVFQNGFPVLDGNEAVRKAHLACHQPGEVFQYVSLLLYSHSCVDATGQFARRLPYDLTAFRWLC